MNGDRWKTKDGREGLEVGRNEAMLYLAIIQKDWPFPNAPIPIPRKDCKLMPSRYLQDQVPFEEALF